MKKYKEKFLKCISIRGILDIYFVVLIVTTIAVLYSASTKFMSKTMMNNYFSEYLDSVYSDFDRTLNNKFVQLNIVATNITLWNKLYNIIENEEYSYEKKNEEIYNCTKRFLNSHDWIYGIDFVAADKSVYRTCKDKIIGYDTLPPEFGNSVDKIKMSIYDGIVSNSEGRYIAVRKKFHNYISGRNSGYFIMYINVESIFPIHNETFGDVSFAVMVNNTVISCADSNMQGKKMSLPFQTDSSNIVKDYKLTNEILSTPVTIVESVSMKSLEDTSKKINECIIVVMFILFAITAVVVMVLMKNFLKNLMRLKKCIVDFSNKPTGNTEFKTNNELYALRESFSKMKVTINDLIAENAEIYEKKRMAEIEMHQAQINPHFIYNAIDLITCMAILKGQKEIEEVTYALATFFRIGLSGGKTLIPIKDELYHVKSYLQIEQARFPDLFDISFAVDEDLYDIPIVKVVLQPLVENAIKHSLRKISHRGKLEISGKEIENGKILFCVSDNGIGMDDKLIDEINSKGYADGFGLKNVHQRLELEYGSGVGPFIEKNAGGGITVKIIIKKGKYVEINEIHHILYNSRENAEN